MNFKDSHDFKDSRKEFLDFHEFRDSHIEFYDFHDVHYSHEKIKICMIFVIIVRNSMIFII